MLYYFRGSERQTLHVTHTPDVPIEDAISPETGTQWRCYQRGTYGQVVGIGDWADRNDRMDPIDEDNYRQ